MKISKGKVVSIDYTVSNNQGETLDASGNRGPLIYLHGHKNIIPGLERALEGRETGESINAVVPPEDGYGQHNPRLIQTVPRTAFQGVDKIEPGMQFQGRGPDGQQAVVRVIEVTDESVKIDANHPLVGIELSFAVTIRDVRDATPEEIEHGHVHAPGAHHHH
ncbi:MAG: peptidylprolyl isomerase [Phycisphaerales bacterium]|nr:peptidylprolyl isomerase [Phycisphaerales bacterium]